MNKLGYVINKYVKTDNLKLEENRDETQQKIMGFILFKELTVLDPLSDLRNDDVFLTWYVDNSTNSP